MGGNKEREIGEDHRAPNFYEIFGAVSAMHREGKEIPPEVQEGFMAAARQVGYELTKDILPEEEAKMAGELYVGFADEYARLSEAEIAERQKLLDIQEKARNAFYSSIFHRNKENPKTTEK